MSEGYKVIVFAHAGLEDEIYPLPEWQDVYRAFIDAGAYAVVATHPHIVQGWEVYQGRRIYYSLGNFAFDKENATLEWQRGMILSIDTKKDEFMEILTRYENGKVLRENSSELKALLKENCRVISDRQKLENIANETAVRLWKVFYRDYYLWAFPIGIRGIIRGIISKLRRKRFPRQVNELMLYHNLAIETHNWVVRRYLMEQYRKEWQVK